MEKAIIKIDKVKKGYAGNLIIGDKTMPIPSHYSITDDSLHDKECEVLREKGQVLKVVVDGQELPRKMQKKYVKQKAKVGTINDQPASSTREPASLPDSFQIEKTTLPKDTRDLGLESIDNFSLKLHKAARYDDKKKGFRFYNAGKKGDPAFEIKPDFGTSPINEIAARQYAVIKRLVNWENTAGNNLAQMIFKPDWRFIVGLGNESVYETSMTLHHIYGIPYIPGQAIKGLVRHWVIEEYFDSREAEAIDCDAFRKIFGAEKNKNNPAQSGQVIFYDAMPICPLQIKVDIMNPHYQPYYSKGQAPGDYHDPNPIFFLTVENTEFQFLLGIKAGNKQEINSEHLGSGKILDLVIKWLRQALEFKGIGAKTSVGYGYMRN